MIWRPGLFHFLSGTRFLIVVVLCLARHGSPLSLQALNSHFTVFSLHPRLPLEARLASWLCFRVFVSFALLRLCQPSFHSVAQSDQRILTNITALVLTMLCYCLSLLEGKDTFFSLLPNMTFFQICCRHQNNSNSPCTSERPPTTKWLYFLP